MTHTASVGRAAAQAELGRQATKLIIACVLVVLSIVALFAPGWGVMPGNMLGGGTSVELALESSDGSELTSEQVSSALNTLKARAAALYEYGVEVEPSADNAVSVRVPSMYDAESVAESLIGTGHVEFVSQLDISDADELELLQNSSSNLTLAEGTYTAFLTNENISAAKVVTSGSGTSMVYAVQVTFDEAGTSAFEAETEELASSYGIVAVVVDGEVVATPYVSSKIEGSEVTISGGFTRDQAYALAAKLESGELGVTATVGESTAFEDICSGFAPWASVGVLVLLCVAASLVLFKLFGSAGVLAGPSLFFTSVCGLGLMALVALFGHVILGTWELGAGIVVAALSVAVSALAAYTYKQQRAGGASVRKSQQLASASFMFVERCFVVLVVVALVATFFVQGGAAEFAWAFACGMAAEVILAWLVKDPLLCVVTAPDTVVAEDSAQQGASEKKTSSKSSE